MKKNNNNNKQVQSIRLMTNNSYRAIWQIKREKRQLL